MFWEIPIFPTFSGEWKVKLSRIDEAGEGDRLRNDLSLVRLVSDTFLGVWNWFKWLSRVSGRYCVSGRPHLHAQVDATLTSVMLRDRWTPHVILCVKNSLQLNWISLFHTCYRSIAFVAFNIPRVMLNSYLHLYHTPVSYWVSTPSFCTYDMHLCCHITLAYLHSTPVMLNNTLLLTFFTCKGHSWSTYLHLSPAMFTYTPPTHPNRTKLKYHIVYPQPTRTSP